MCHDIFWHKIYNSFRCFVYDIKTTIKGWFDTMKITRDNNLFEIGEHVSKHKIKVWTDFFMLQIEYSYTMPSLDYYAQLEAQLNKLCGEVFRVHLKLSSSGPLLGIGQCPAHYVATLRCFFEQYILRSLFQLPPSASNSTWCTYRIWMQRFIGMSHNTSKVNMRTCSECSLTIPMQYLIHPNSCICTVCHESTKVWSPSHKNQSQLIPTCSMTEK
jgi:hypothetical protein